jgi:hypothetical protein
LSNGVYGLVIDWVSAFEREGKTMMLSEEDFAIVWFTDKVFSLVKEKLVSSSVLSIYIDSLSIACCKIALLDISFYTKSTHIARQLLNTVFKATTGLNDQEMGYAKPIMATVNDVVREVLINYQESSDIFAIILADFKVFLSQYEQRIAVVEKRLRDTEIGKYNAKKANDYVLELISRLLKGVRLPSTVDAFIRNEWEASLQWILLKEGSQSAPWKKMLKLTETLIWCFGDRNDDDIKVMRHFMKTLLTGLRRSLYSIQHDDLRVMTAVEPIEAALMRVLTGEPLVLYECEPIDGIDVDVDVDCEDTISSIPSDSLGFIESLHVGDWIFVKKTDGCVQFAKLAVIISGKGAYIFVNRAGMRLFEYGKLALAMAHKNKEIFLVEKGIVFDTAIAESVRHFRQIQLSNNHDKNNNIMKSNTIKNVSDKKPHRQATTLTTALTPSKQQEILSNIPVDKTSFTTHERDSSEVPTVIHKAPLDKENVLRNASMLDDDSLLSVDKVRERAKAKPEDRSRVLDEILDELSKMRRNKSPSSNEILLDKSQCHQEPPTLTEPLTHKRVSEANSIINNDINDKKAADKTGLDETVTDEMQMEKTDVDQTVTRKTVKESEAIDQHAEKEPLTETTKKESVDDKNINNVECRLTNIDVYLDDVDGINIGGWIDYSKDNESIVCKLAVKMKATERMIFVNRVGEKVLDTHREELAELMAKGCVTIVDKGRAFDRALESVVKSIRQEKDNKRL